MLALRYPTTEIAGDSLAHFGIDLSPAIPPEDHLGTFQLPQVFFKKALDFVKDVGEILFRPIQAVGVYEDSDHNEIGILGIVAALIDVANLHLS